MYRQSEKNLFKQQYLLQMFPQYGELRPTNGWDLFTSLGHPIFNEFRVLAALLHGTLVVGVSQTLRRWTEGVTCIRQGGHHVGHWPTFLFCKWRVVYGAFTDRRESFCKFNGWQIFFYIQLENLSLARFRTDRTRMSVFWNLKKKL